MVKQKKAKKFTTKKLTKKLAEDIKLDIAKMKLKDKERVYEEYIKVLVKYNITEVSRTAIMYDELHLECLKRRIKFLKDDKKEIANLLFGEFPKSEIDGVNKSIEYYNKLISVSEIMINRMSYEIKTKIANDAVKQQHAWLSIPE